MLHPDAPCGDSYSSLLHIQPRKTIGLNHPLGPAALPSNKLQLSIVIGHDGFLICFLFIIIEELFVSAPTFQDHFHFTIALLQTTTICLYSSSLSSSRPQQLLQKPSIFFAKQHPRSFLMENPLFLWKIQKKNNIKKGCSIKSVERKKNRTSIVD